MAPDALHPTEARPVRGGVSGRGLREWHRWHPVWRAYLLDLASLVWPTACVACGAPDRDLCDSCATGVRNVGIVRPEYRGADGGSTSIPYFIAGPYDGAVRKVLIAFKHAGMHGFVRPLGERLGMPLRAACAQTTVYPTAPGRVNSPLLVTIPSRPARVRSRGYRHVDDLVRVAVRRERLPLQQVRALRVLRGRTGQVGLDAEGRERNARRIAVRRSSAILRGREIILVDDIVTTGATTRAACEVLERAGGRVIAVVCICSAGRKDAPVKTQVEAQR